jgi:hypothetical protein
MPRKLKVRRTTSSVWWQACRRSALFRGHWVPRTSAYEPRRVSASARLGKLSELRLSRHSHLLDVVSIDPRKANTEASKARLAQITAEWDNQKNRTTAESRLSNYQSKIGGQRSTNILVALPIILRRMWKNLFRQQEVVSRGVKAALAKFLIWSLTVLQPSHTTRWSRPCLPGEFVICLRR